MCATLPPTSRRLPAVVGGLECRAMLVGRPERFVRRCLLRRVALTRTLDPQVEKPRTLTSRMNTSEASTASAIRGRGSSPTSLAFRPLSTWARRLESCPRVAVVPAPAFAEARARFVGSMSARCSEGAAFPVPVRLPCGQASWPSPALRSSLAAQGQCERRHLHRPSIVPSFVRRRKT